MDTKREGVCLEACALCAANDRLECTRVLAPRMARISSQCALCCGSGLVVNY